MEEAMDAIRVFVAILARSRGLCSMNPDSRLPIPTEFLPLMRVVNDDAGQAHRSSEDVTTFTTGYPLCTQNLRMTDRHAVRG